MRMLLSPPAIALFALLLFAVVASACERNNDLVAQEQIAQSRNACPKGCEIAPPGCTIKGNISTTGLKIYHTADQASWDGIRITPATGERWFCTEVEARANGWTKAAK